MFSRLMLASVVAMLSVGALSAEPYVGAMVGYTAAQMSSKAINGTTVIKNKISADGFDAGIMGGWEHRFDAFYLAGELNYMGYDAKGTYHDSTMGNTKYRLVYSYGIDAIPGFFIAKNLKLFVMLGYQSGDFKFKRSANDGTSFDKEKSLSAYDLGAGGEFVLANNFYLRLSYKFTDYGSAKMRVGATFREKVEPYSNQFNIGIIYHFV